MALAAWIGAWMHARNPANFNAQEEAERLRHHAAWLEQRLAVARREQWGHDMIGDLTAELSATAQQLARVQQGSAAR